MTTKVLIVDDSKTTQRIIATELADAGYEIHTAENGYEAFEKAREIRPDVITMDVDMPKMDGFEAVSKIRSELQLKSKQGQREIPIIFVTANDTIEGRQKGFEVGATEFILKPFTKGEISDCVHSLLTPGDSMQGMNVLIVEDSGITRNIINNILKTEGIDTRMAADGKEALAIMKANGQNIDMVLTDYMMPEMNGAELCHKIRNELGYRTLPIIIISAMTETGSMLELFKVGASDYIIKPFAKEELLARVKVHLESRTLTKQLSEQVYQLKRLSKMQDEFLSITSHDLRSPLAGIMGYADLVLHDPSLTEQNKGYLKRVMDSGEFLLDLISDILDLGQVQSENLKLDMQPQSLQELLDSAVNTVRHMASPKEIELVKEYRYHTPPIIIGDKNALIRIFNNLLSNAIKFTPRGGTIRLVIEKGDDNQLNICVIDTGVGVPAEMVPHLFEKFSKASRPGTAGEKSTGLGLSITKELVEQHSGSITVISAEGQGSCFELSFPLSEPQGEEPEEQKEVDFGQSTEPETASVRILIADDNKMNIKLARLALSRKGHDVSAVVNGKQAYQQYLESVQENGNPFDIIFMDIRMPVMDGIEATRLIRVHEAEVGLKPVPIVAITGKSGVDWESQVSQIGLDGSVTKPVNIDRVQELIRKFTKTR